MALVGWWPLDGNTNDYTVNQNNGVNNNVTFVNGKIGQAANFDSQTDGINILNVNLSEATAISFAVWINPSTATGPFSRWLSGSIGSVHYPDLAIDVSTRTLRYIFFPAISDWVVTTTTINFNEWTHLVYTFYKSGKVEIYKNSTLSFTNQHAAFTSFSTSYNYMLGSRYDFNNERIVGSLNDFRIYNHALSQKEINELAKAKVLHYVFNKDESITYDASGLRRDISKIGTPVWNSTGKLGSGSYTFSSGSRLQRPSSFPVSSDRLTLAAWVYPTGTHTNDRGIVIQENGNYYLTVTPTQQIAAYWYSTSNEGYHTTTETLPLNTWSHIATVWNGTQNLIYINGILVKTTATNTPGRVSASLPVTVGGENNGTRFFVGSIDDTRIYATALTTVDILDIYRTRAKIDNKGNLYANEFVEDYEVTPGLTLTQLFENNNEYVRFGTTGTVNGITRTLQSDDSWILSGTATANSEAPLSNFFGTTGLYYFNGMGTNDSNVGTRIIVWFNNSITSFQIFSNGESVLKQFDQPTQNNLRIWYNVLNGNTVNNMRIRPLAVNTTTVFGAGNEPSKEQLDAWYRDYSQSRTKSNGQIITRELNEVSIDARYPELNNLSLKQVFEDNNLMPNPFVDVNNNGIFDNAYSGGSPIVSFVDGFQLLQSNFNNIYIINPIGTISLNNNYYVNFQAQKINNAAGNFTIGFGADGSFISLNRTSYTNISFDSLNRFSHIQAITTTPVTNTQLLLSGFGGVSSNVKFNDFYIANLTALGINQTKAQMDAWYLKYKQLKLTNQKQRITKDMIVINGEIKEV